MIMERILLLVAAFTLLSVANSEVVNIPRKLSSHSNAVEDNGIHIPRGLNILASLLKNAEVKFEERPDTQQKQLTGDDEFYNYIILGQYAGDEVNCGGQIIYTQVVSSQVCYGNFLYDMYAFGGERYLTISIQSDGESFLLSVDVYMDQSCSQFIGTLPFSQYPISLGCQPPQPGNPQYTHFAVSNSKFVPSFAAVTHS